MGDQPRKSFRHFLRPLIRSKDRPSSSSRPASPAPAAIDSTDVSHVVSTDEPVHPQPPKASPFSMPFGKKRPKNTSILGNRPSSPTPGVDAHLQQPAISSGSSSNNQAGIMTIPNNQTINCNDPTVWVSSQRDRSGLTRLSGLSG